jgi:hypothetical protein
MKPISLNNRLKCPPVELRLFSKKYNSACPAGLKYHQ